MLNQEKPILGGICLYYSQLTRVPLGRVRTIVLCLIPFNLFVYPALWLAYPKRIKDRR